MNNSIEYSGLYWMNIFLNEYFGFCFEWIFFWMNILDFVLNWILNWIIFRPNSMKKWIFKTYRTGLSVSGMSGIGNTRPNLHFFQYIQAYKPFADHVPRNTKQYQLILTKYQPVSSYTDPVPSSTTYNSSSCKGTVQPTAHLMSHAQYTWSSLTCFHNMCPM